jgi:hypothetical protein
LTPSGASAGYWTLHAPVVVLARPMQGAVAGRVVVRPQGHPGGARSARAERVGGRAPTGAAPAVRHILRRFPTSQPATPDKPPTDRAPAASQTPFPLPYSSPSVPDIAPSHHTHFHLSVRTIFLRHEIGMDVSPSGRRPVGSLTLGRLASFRGSGHRGSGPPPFLVPVIDLHHPEVESGMWLRSLRLPRVRRPWH